MTRKVPFLRISLHFLHIFFTEDRTFILLHSDVLREIRAYLLPSPRYTIRPRLKS